MDSTNDDNDKEKLCDVPATDGVRTTLIIEKCSLKDVKTKIMKE